MGNNLSESSNIDDKTNYIIGKAKYDMNENPARTKDAEFKSLSDSFQMAEYKILDIQRKTEIKDTEFSLQTFSKNNVFKWDMEDKSKKIKIENEITARVDTPFNDSHMIKSFEGIHEGYHVYEIYWPKKTRGTGFSIIGLSTSTAETQMDGKVPLCGLNKNSVGWDLNSRKVIFDNKVVCNYRSKSEEIPDYFLMIIDFQEGSISFRSNDVDFGVCFTGLNEFFKYQNLFVTACLTDHGTQLSVRKFPFLLSVDGFLEDFSTFTLNLMNYLRVIEKEIDFRNFADFMFLLSRFLSDCSKFIFFYNVVVNLITKCNLSYIINDYLQRSISSLHLPEVNHCLLTICQFVRSVCLRNVDLSINILDDTFFSLIFYILEFSITQV